MNDGKDPYELMKEIRLPEHLRVGEDYGTVPWAVRAIWHGYGGWFYFHSTTELYDSPVREIFAQLARMAGPDELASYAQTMLDLNRPLHAIHLTEIATAAEPYHRHALGVYLRAHQMLLAQSHQRNRWQKYWLEGEIDATQAKLRGKVPERG